MVLDILLQLSQDSVLYANNINVHYILNIKPFDFDHIVLEIKEQLYSVSCCYLIFSLVILLPTLLHRTHFPQHYGGGSQHISGSSF